MSKIFGQFGFHAIKPGYDALVGVFGRAIVPTSLAVAAGSAVGVAAACATGGAILLIPSLILNLGLEFIIPDNTYPKLNLMLSFAMNTGLSCGSAALGASMFGLAVNPIILCALAGSIAVAMAVIAVKATFELLKMVATDAVTEIAAILPGF